MKLFKVAGTDVLLSMARRLLDRKEITTEQYKIMQERNNKLAEIEREDITIRS